MCKIGVVSIGIDLYNSAYQQFVTLLLHFQLISPLENASKTVIADGSIRNVILSLTAHLLALMTLVQTFRGRVNRQVAGRVVFPVLAVKFMLQLEGIQRRQKFQQQQEQEGDVLGIQQILGVKEVLILIKSIVFIVITAKLAFGKDISYVEYDEWFPRKKKHSC